MTVKRRITGIQIQFVAPGGKSQSTIIPIKQDTRRLHHGEWTAEQSIKKFAWYLARGDRLGILAAYDAAIRLGVLREALAGCLIPKRPDRRKTQTLLSLWNERGLWSLPRALGDDLPIFANTIRHYAPPYEDGPVTLYRGQSLSRYKRGVLGIAWTSRRSIAEQFAQLRETPGVVVQLAATPNEIVARVRDFISTRKTDPANRCEFEDEYIIDSRMIAERVVVVDGE